MAAVTQVRILVTAYFEPLQVCEEQPFFYVSSVVCLWREFKLNRDVPNDSGLETEEGDIAQW